MAVHQMGRHRIPHLMDLFTETVELDGRTYIRSDGAWQVETISGGTAPPAAGGHTIARLLSRIYELENPC